MTDAEKRVVPNAIVCSRGGKPTPCPKCGAHTAMRLLAGIGGYSTKQVCTRCLWGREEEGA